MAFKLGELLVGAKLITEDQLRHALHAQRTYGGKLGTNLVELGFISDRDLAAFLAKQLHMQPAEAHEFENIPPTVVGCVSRADAIKYQVIPLKLDARLRVAISDPATLNEINTIGFKLGKGVQMVIAPEIWIVAALERYYKHMRETRYISLEPVGSGSDIEIVLEEDLTLQANDYVAVESYAPSLSFPEYVKKLVKAESVKDVFSCLFEYLGGFFSKMAIYGIREKKVRGLMLHGFAVHNRLFSEISYDYDASTFLRPIAESKKPFVGAIPAALPENTLFTPLGLLQAQNLGFYPIVFQDQPVAVLLAVAPESKAHPKPQAGRLIEEAAIKAGIALEFFTAKKKLLSVSSV